MSNRLACVILFGALLAAAVPAHGSTVAAASRVADPATIAWARDAVVDLERAVPSAARADALAQRAETEGRAPVAAELVAGAAHRGVVVDESFVALLGRGPEPAARTFFADVLGRVPTQAVWASILAGEDFFMQAGSTADGYVRLLYERVLGRPTESAAIAYWVPIAGSATGRQTVAEGVLASVEGRRRTVRVLYERYLDRGPDAAGVAFFADALAAVGVEGVTTALVASDEAVTVAGRPTDELWLLLGPARGTAAMRLARVSAPTLDPTTGTVVLTNLLALVAIDVRPATQVLYALGNDGRLYTVDTGTGATAPVGAPVAALAGGDDVGFGFDPVTGEIRVTRGAATFRLDPDTGAVLGQGSQLYTDGGPAPSMTGLAADTATAYAIDTGRDRLVRGAGGNGIVQMVGSLGSNAGSNVGFDIASTGGSWAVFRVGELQRLHRVDLGTGHATYVADAPIEPGGSSNVVGAAIVGP